MAKKDFDHLFKILLIGDAGVGKSRSVTHVPPYDSTHYYANHVPLPTPLFCSSILLRYCDDTFDPHLGSTIGVDFKVKMLDLRGRRVKMTIWDTAGQERFRTLTSSYYRGAQGIILVYDTTRKETFDSLDQWLREMEVYCPGGGREVVKLLVGNKVDSPSVVEREEAEEWARSRGMLFLESSAKTDVGIAQAFEEVVEKVLDNPILLINTAPSGSKAGSSARLGAPPPQQQGGTCC
jgi:Ras-related protein Rab-18